MCGGHGLRPDPTRCLLHKPCTSAPTRWHNGSGRSGSPRLKARLQRRSAAIAKGLDWALRQRLDEHTSQVSVLRKLVGVVRRHAGCSTSEGLHLRRRAALPVAFDIRGMGLHLAPQLARDALYAEELLRLPHLRFLRGEPHDLWRELCLVLRQDRRAFPLQLASASS